MIYFITSWTSTGLITGTGRIGDSTPAPSGSIPCTQTQAENPSLWQVDLSTIPYTLVQSLAGAQAAQIAGIKAGFVSATAAIPFTIGGTDYVADTSGPKQAADLAMVIAAANAIYHPVAWAASTAVGPNAIVQLSGGAFLFTAAGGTTGTTAPTPPTTFGTTVTDGTVTWELYGRTLEMSDGSHATFTPQELLSVFQQVDVYIHYQKNQKLNLLAQIAAATTVSAVQAIVW